MSDVPGNGIAFRLQSLERRLDRIEALEPAVMKQEIRDMKEDVRAIRRDMAVVRETFTKDVGGLRRVLIGFIVSFSVGTGMLIVVLLTQLGNSGGS